MKAKWLILLVASVVVAGGFFALKARAAGDAEAADVANTTDTANAASTGPRGLFLKRLADRLDLSASQRTEIRSLVWEDRDTLKSLFQRLHDARVSLRSAIQADNAAETDVRAASAKVAGAEADMAVERMKLFGKIRPVLTGAQRAKLSELEQNFDGLADSLIARAGDD